ncbi:glycosyltransferase family 25 protein [Polynucleobacter meluiroseus]|uniref:glycosyltransferase family 25 protein n=1 Tax=Polynucleobacter meluiroseus TaxID=1938814 RepID=UPI00235037C5|nr:glycosyltransferase family 25 protein [Polynucleobacter meluiroseus]
MISMLRSPDRRARASEELEKTSLDWRFLDGVDGQLLVFPIPEYDAKKVEKLLGHPLTLGEIGVFLSHKAAWQSCVDQNKPTLILEDDFILLPQFEKTIDALLSYPSDWDMFRLQGLKSADHILLQKLGDLSVVYNKSDALGLTASLVHPRAAQKLLNYSQKIYEPVDHFMEHRARHGLQFLAVNPYPCEISQAPTTIDHPDRQPIRGGQKIKRSVWRWLDRKFSQDPWFPR